jgi:hypothetical protein
MARKKTLWFGTEEYREWVMCPDQGLQMNSVGWNDNGVFLNGGAWSANSDTVHRAYSANFTGDYETVQAVLDFAAGQFGPGPYYFIDPFSQGSNSLSAWLASPRLMASDAPCFTGAVRPTLAVTGANALRLPTKSAVFTVGTSSDLSTFRFAVPSGFTAHVRWWGSKTGTANLRVNTTDVAPVTTTTFTSDFLDISLTGTGTITISGIMVQLLATGETPDFSVFKSGRGTTAVAITDTQLTGYSAIRSRVAATLSLLEVGGWENA